MLAAARKCAKPIAEHRLGSWTCEGRSAVRRHCLPPTERLTAVDGQPELSKPLIGADVAFDMVYSDLELSINFFSFYFTTAFPRIVIEPTTATIQSAPRGPVNAPVANA